MPTAEGPLCGVCIHGAFFDDTEELHTELGDVHERIGRIETRVSALEARTDGSSTGRHLPPVKRASAAAVRVGHRRHRSASRRRSLISTLSIAISSSQGLLVEERPRVAPSGKRAAFIQAIADAKAADEKRRAEWFNQAWCVPANELIS